MRIKLFESFNRGLTEQEIRDCLVDLSDQGYDIFVTQSYIKASSFDKDSPNYIKLDEKLGGYQYNIIAIKSGHDFFTISNVSEPIIEMIDYLSEKYGDRFLYSVEYVDVNTEEEIEIEIDDFEQFLEDYPLEDTWEVIVTLRIDDEK